MSGEAADPALAHVAGPEVTEAAAVAAVKAWVGEHVPASWREAGERGGPAEVRKVRRSAEYRSWYPVFGRSGLVAAGWEVRYGGLAWPRPVARAVEQVLAPYHLPRLNPLGLNLAAPALFAYGTEEQRLRFLPPIVRAEEEWCQLFSEPGSGSDLASLSTRAERAGDEWVINGSKIWTTWADKASFAVLLARTNPDVPKHEGITYFLIDMRQPGVQIRPLPHMGGEVEFFQTFLDGARVPDFQRVGAEGQGWKVAQATLRSGWRARCRPTGCPGAGTTRGPGTGWCGCTARSGRAAGRTSGCAPGSPPAGRPARKARSARCTRQN
jgi:alkylation response protein AidB-like acyl-CoA dehydrogenase